MAGDDSTFERGLRKAVAAPFRTALFVVLALIIAMVGRMLIDLAYTGSDPERLAEMHDALLEEIAAADTLPHVFGSPSERAMRWALGAYDIMYVMTGLDRSMIATPADFTELDVALRRGVDAAAAQPHWKAMIVGTELMAARAAQLPALLPTILFGWALALLDGAVARWIRREAGGRESSTIYHRAKYMHATLATLVLIVWFWSPIRLERWQLGLLVAAVGASFMRIQLMYYKKYI